MKRLLILAGVGAVLIGLAIFGGNSIKKSNNPEQVSATSTTVNVSKPKTDASKNSVLGSSSDSNSSSNSTQVSYNSTSVATSHSSGTADIPAISNSSTGSSSTGGSGGGSGSGSTPTPTPTTPTPDPTPTPTEADNLIANASVEDSTNGTPNSWSASFYGNNTSSLTYESTGHTGAHSLKTTVSTWTDGAADWFFSPVSVTAGKTYKYTEWYKGDVDSEVDAAVTFADGTTSFYIVKQAPAAADWTQFSGTFSVPANGVSVSIYHVLAKVGTVQNDDFSLALYTPVGFNRALVSLTFDDALMSQITDGLPLLNQYGFKATFYIMTGPVADHDNNPDNMTVSDLQTLVAGGHEIAAHTIDHPDLTTVDATTLNNQLSQPKSDLEAWLSTNVTDFATPFGAYNPTVIAAIQQYYASHRSTDEGLNSKDNFDIYNIKVRNILSTTTPAEVQGWVNEAIATKSWLVIVYHEVGPALTDPSDPSPLQYNVLPADLNAELSLIQQSGVAVVPVNQALAEIQPQL